MPVTTMVTMAMMMASIAMIGSAFRGRKRKQSGNCQATCKK
jgi:hypothetical protein